MKKSTLSNILASLAGTALLLALTLSPETEREMGRAWASFTRSLILYPSSAPYDPNLDSQVQRLRRNPASLACSPLRGLHQRLRLDPQAEPGFQRIATFEVNGHECRAIVSPEQWREFEEGKRFLVSEYFDRESGLCGITAIHGECKSTP
jgi:hypothetical protein